MLAEICVVQAFIVHVDQYGACSLFIFPLSSAPCSGIDVVQIMEYLGLPESIISPLRKSGLNYIATASALYKLATPARYTVTLGGTSIAIRLLVKRGLIKPMPTRGELRQMLRDKMKPQ